jgi:quinol monooxygenase YgiN
MNADGPAPLTGGGETALVTMAFEASDPDALLAALSKYVVLARGAPGCRNVDLCTSFTRPARFVIIEKWDSTERAHTHFDSDVMVEMARACQGILAAAPEIDLLEGLSAHDLA